MTIKQQILTELNSLNFPNLKLLYDEKSLDLALEVLSEELAKEKKKFKNLLKIKNEDLTFDSFEDDGVLDYYWSLLNHLENVDGSEKIRKIIETFRPKLQDFGNEVAYSKEYFKKLEYVNKKLKTESLKLKGSISHKTNLSSDNLSEQLRIMYLRIKAYKDRGINLNEKKQKRLKEINKKLGKLNDKFGNNVVDDKKKFEYLITDFEVIKDLPKEVLEIAKNSGKLKVKSGKEKKLPLNLPLLKVGKVQILPVDKWELEGGKEVYLFDSDPTSYNAIMKYCSSAKIRQDFEKANYKTASKGKFDNRKIILEILKLREEKAKILGYKNYAGLSLNSKMAENTKEVLKLLENIYKKAKIKAKIDLKELKKHFSLKELNSYDIAYYSRILKEQKYEIDEKKLKEFFEFESILDYLHRFIEKFYGIEIRSLKLKPENGKDFLIPLVEAEARNDQGKLAKSLTNGTKKPSITKNSKIKPVLNLFQDSEGQNSLALLYDEDVRVYEIYKDKKLISYYFLDPFFKKGKRPGAWADNLRGKTYLGIQKVPIIVNVCNFQKALRGKTTLYLRDVETIFHEFGHAIHEILSESKYSELSGFGVEWDFVELPSQLLENWVKEKESLKKLAKHSETGKRIPANIIEKLEKLKTFMTGVFWMRQNEFALLDMNIYSIKPPKDIKILDKKTLEIVNKYSLFERKMDYKMYCSFTHIFDGGYAAGYYSYMRAEIIEADVFSKIKKMGMFSPKTGEELLKTIIGQGTRKKANELFFDFMGRKVKDKAFLERYGL